MGSVDDQRFAQTRSLSMACMVDLGGALDSVMLPEGAHNWELSNTGLPIGCVDYRKWSGAVESAWLHMLARAVDRGYEFPKDVSGLQSIQMRRCPNRLETNHFVISPGHVPLPGLRMGCSGCGSGESWAEQSPTSRKRRCETQM